MNDNLKEAIEKITSNLSLNDLGKARDSLTAKYRDKLRYGKAAKTFMDSQMERLSYLVTRFPATHGVILRVLTEIKKIIPNLQIKNMLDLGSGPGTAFFAAEELFETLENAHLIEQDKELIGLGTILSNHLKSQCHVEWQEGDIVSFKNLRQYELVTISYALNELEKKDQSSLIEKAFEATTNLLVLIEPGTMEGFDLIRQARSQLIGLGAHIIAPCPHAFACPMKENDWCHFATRISRTSTHRQLKQGALGHEDEKFSYIAVSKIPAKLPMNRILRHPEKHSGHLTLELCTHDGSIQNKTISKRDGELYKQARKLEWGNTF